MEKTLYDLMSESLVITKNIMENDGEIDAVTNELMNFHMEELVRKVDSYIFVMDRLTSDEKYLREKAAKFEHAARSLKNARERIKDRIEELMLANEIYELQGSLENLKLIQSKDKLVVDENILPEAYKMQVVTYEVDKELIRKELSLGNDVPGASLQKNYYVKGVIKK